MIDSAHVLVVGSANLDYIIKVDVPPGPGETILAKQMVRHPGGKGANQAVAAARMDVSVQFVGCVGDDPDGGLILRELQSEGVDTSAVEIVAHMQTGLALVSVFDSGENSITVIPGANFALQASRVKRAVATLERNPIIIVLQAEVKPSVNTAAVTAASDPNINARIVLNLAPYSPVSAEILAACDPLVVNQSEAGAMVGYEIVDRRAAERAVAELVSSVRSVVITLGADGACWGQRDERGYVAAPVLDAVVDTTGAGDAFVGALAAELATGASLEDAVKLGVEAGSFAVGRFGAQSSYPLRAHLRPSPANAID